METKTIDYKKYFNEMNKFNTDGLFDSHSNDLLFKTRSIPKGFLSEYQHSYLNAGEKKGKQVFARPKDNLSFGNKSFLQESIILENIKPKQQNDPSQLPVRSKTLNRLNNMIPNNTENSKNSVTWYQADFNYYGSDDQNLDKSNEFHNELINKQPTIVDSYKNNYIKNFDELNKGLVDSYSLSKGGALLQIRNELKNSSRDTFNSAQIQKMQHQQPRPHDLRSVWIPKKFEGRNMFASHIDSTIFPDKNDKEFDTDYNQSFDVTAEAKKTFHKPPFEPIEKSVKYVMNHKNEYVPSVRWYPTEKKELIFHDKYQDTTPAKSIYQADFEQPSTNIRRSASLRTNRVHFSKHNLEELQKRKNEIDQILANN